MQFVRLSPPFGRKSARSDRRTLNLTASSRPCRSAGFLRKTAIFAVLCVPAALLLGASPASAQASLSIISPASGSTLPGSSATFTVSANSSVSQYQLWLGTTSGSDNLGVYSSGSTSASSISFTATGLPTGSATVYATLYWDENGSWESSQASFLEAGASAAAKKSGSGSLALGSTSVAFGNVDVNSPATQTVTLTSSGTGSVTISGISISGTGFSDAGVSTPLTLNSKQSASLQLEFDPTKTGSFTGTVTITSNASNGGTMQIALSGTGQAASSGHSVDLSWDAPSSSSDPVAGYNIYRAPSGSSLYTLLNSSPTSSTSYTDATVQSGSTYTYEVESVDSSSVESQPSNVFSATIP